MAEKKGRWITTKNGRHVFIPEGKDVGEVLKEKFGDDNDSEDTEFDYSKYDTDNDKEFEITDEDIMTELSDGDYYYSNLDEQGIYNLMSQRLGISKERVEDGLKKQGFNFEEYQKHINGEDNNEDDKPYDFDKWAKETNSDKTQHRGYIDTNKTYKPEEIMDIVSGDDDFDVIAGGGLDGNVWFKHKSGPHYVWNRQSGKIKLLSKNATNRYEGFEETKKDENNLMFDKNDTKEQHLEKRKKLLGY